ncbi:hypothetical protein [Pseudomonas chlororaphis]|uniref:hypothetical protein n=1 Tax=Pseudomonas chlororaphis TaxID=587753 RepID=UPI0013DE5063|nr:hypothetical protein [Pseudomonas chlororaphis]
MAHKTGLLDAYQGSFEPVCVCPQERGLPAKQALRSVSQAASSFIASKLRSYRILVRGGGGTFLQAKKKDLEFQGLF